MSLRNPNGLAWEPASDVLWTMVNERDELGSDLVADDVGHVIWRAEHHDPPKRAKASAKII